MFLWYRKTVQLHRVKDMKAQSFWILQLECDIFQNPSSLRHSIAWKISEDNADERLVYCVKDVSFFSINDLVWIQQSPKTHNIQWDHQVRFHQGQEFLIFQQKETAQSESMLIYEVSRCLWKFSRQTFYIWDISLLQNQFSFYSKSKKIKYSSTLWIHLLSFITIDK